MRYNLTPKQRRFLEHVLELYNQDKLGTISLPPVRMRNILNNGYYYDNRTSYEKPPMLLTGSNIQANDLDRMNGVGEKMRKYFKEKKIRYND